MNNKQLHNKIFLITKAQGSFLGAAVGDALGWSQEIPSKRLDKQSKSNGVLTTEFQQWVRRSGGQYYPHEEVICSGEYSDDTQLLLCTARSLLSSENWWHHFTRLEIPTWKCYERGGGGATKRSVNDWLSGIEPWFSPKNKKQYFEAGGNGVAMRILPHCLLRATETDFNNVAKDIIANGICTHGHPRALVGALAYGFALWIAFRENETLPYGAIIEKVLLGINSWSKLTNFELGNIYEIWINSAEELYQQQYQKSWQETVKEMQQFLEQCQTAMKQGALSIEQEVLEKLGCFGKNKGSGTISAAASIFLASRYAADPKNGLVEAAFAKGADTDTIASMTGGLLGAIAGVDWLGNYAKQIQDAKYIKSLAEKLIEQQTSRYNETVTIDPITKTHIDNFIKTLDTLQPNASVNFPDGRKAQIVTHIPHKSLSKATIAVSWKLNILDGQTLYVQKLSHQKPSQNSIFDNSDKNLLLVEDEIKYQFVEVVDSVVKITVKDFEKARFFYEKVLGLKIEKQLLKSVRYKGIFLAQSESLNSFSESQNGIKKNLNTTIYIEVKTLEKAYNNASQFKAKNLSPISEKSGRRFFTCLDPGDNTVEILEVGF